ncbi:MAG: RecQ family ATP-dependent DNA helicase [Selenomonadaceae bacterium]|nr:RecQ family ATP-dependent DNA helicase [Selenomonadaceae bacterium]
MEKFSASYGGTKENFIVNVSSQTPVEENIFSVLCTVQNILQRGTPTKPSTFLTVDKKFGEMDAPPIFLPGNSNLSWNSIKGDEQNNYNPAKIFYEEILSEYLGEEYSFVQSLILPEVDFSDILENYSALKGQQVDFYLPQTKTVIEIDGSSHNDPAQIFKDRARDSALLQEKISVIRIKTSDLREKTEKFFAAMNRLKYILSKSEIITEYKQCRQISSNDRRVQFDSVIRLQMALLEYFKKNAEDLSAEILKVKLVESDVENFEEIFKIAYEDLSHWIENVAQLAKINVTLPTLKIVKRAVSDAVTLDFKIFQRYTDSDTFFNAEVKKIYVRTDYFPQKNYYRVASAKSIEYKFTAADEIKDTACLKFFLKNFFGYDDFREGQLAIIKHILSRNDTIGILPTGTGKSLCYQLTALLQPGLTIVIVPLISLMQDQQKSMEEKSINRVAYVSSAVTGAEREKFLTQFENGQVQFMLISPERTQNLLFREYLSRADVNFNMTMAVIDEVHCLSEWGHDFRVSYLRLIPTIRKYCKDSCLLGLTATASQAVLNDIKAEFDDDGSGVKALASMDRSELVFERIIVANDFERDRKILEIINENSGTYTDCHGVEKNCVGLIFCLTIRSYRTNPSVERIAPMIAANFDGSVESFYSELPDKREIQNRFMDKNFSGVMVCTTAFGMGIDKENIKYTINTALPKSIEEFYQQAGRAGRDADKSQKSHCYILYKPEAENFPQATIDKIFNINTDADLRKRLSASLQGDLNSVMFFWNLEKDTVSQEYENIRQVLEMLHKENTLLHFNRDSELKKFQIVLYKLTLLGIVRDWTVEYETLARGTLNVDYVGIDEEAVKSSLLKYIHKYDNEFTFDETITRYKKYHDLMKEFAEKPIKALCYVLITWTNNNIMYSRLQSIYNMMNFCSTEISDEEFRKKINDFFKYTDQVVLFDSIVQRPRAYENWFEILEKNGKVINPAKASSTATSLLRYLESYGQNTGLNFLNGMLRLICDEYEPKTDWRLTDSLKNIKESTTLDVQKKILDRTIHIAQNFDDKRKSMLSQAVLKVFPERREEIHSSLKDSYSLSVIVDEHTLKLKKMLEASFSGLFGKS